jgi:hypothetical protein
MESVIKIENVSYLEIEINEILQNFINENVKYDFKNEDNVDKFLFTYFNEKNSIGDELAMSWFNKKGCQEFCRGVGDIQSIVINKWKTEFNQELCDSFLTPHEMIKTYVYCKAKQLSRDKLKN